MDQAGQPLANCRRNGWTPERRRQFLECLAAGWPVSRSCERVGLSREAAYRLRRRDPAFARAWETALRDARRAAEERFLATLPEKLRRTMSELSGGCKPGGAGFYALDCVRSVAPV